MTDLAERLRAIGVEDLGGGLVDDTAANKRALRRARFSWDTVVSEDGEYSRRIKVWSDEELAARTAGVWESMKPILRDPGDRYSEYVSAEEFPTDFDDAPVWVMRRREEWINDRIAYASGSGRRPRPFPVRCVYIRGDGTRCWEWAPGAPEGGTKTHDPEVVAASRRCARHQPSAHSGQHDNVRVRAAAIAREKIYEALPSAADELISLALEAEGENIRLRANETLLSIGGLKAGSTLDVTVRPEGLPDPAAEIRERLDKLAAAAVKAAELAAAAEPETDIVEGVIVAEGEAEVVHEPRGTA